MVKITQVEAIPLFASFAEAFEGAVPPELSQPAFSMRNNPLLGQGAVIVRIETDGGLVGIGEAMGRPGPRGTAAHINEVLAPMLIGADPRHHQALWTAMNEQMRFAPMGISGVDMALWDLRGKIYGDSLPNLLGGARRDAVDCYASPIPYLASPRGLGPARARKFLHQGFHAVKLKIGRGLQHGHRSRGGCARSHRQRGQAAGRCQWRIHRGRLHRPGQGTCAAGRLLAGRAGPPGIPGRPGADSTAG